MTNAQNEVESAAYGLLDFIQACPSMFHTQDTLRSRLLALGFTYVAEGEPWVLKPGGSYMTSRNDSSLIAWKVGRNIARPHQFAMPDAGASSVPFHFQISVAHGDSPTFKIKSVDELGGQALMYALIQRPMAA